LCSPSAEEDSPTTSLDENDAVDVFGFTEELKESAQRKTRKPDIRLEVG
jgi:hypothetical protein